MIKTILHLCADIGSDSYPYELDDDYQVIKVGVDVGVENISYIDGTLFLGNTLIMLTTPIQGIIANPVCTEFSGANRQSSKDEALGMVLVNECLRVIRECAPVWHIIENPATGSLRNYLGTPDYTYQPWQFGSPWTKRTALWGNFNHPVELYRCWADVPKNDSLYVRPGRPKPSLAFLHKSALKHIPEFAPFAGNINCDADFRSLCSQGFSNEFKNSNP